MATVIYVNTSFLHKKPNANKFKRKKTSPRENAKQDPTVSSRLVLSISFELWPINDAIKISY